MHFFFFFAVNISGLQGSIIVADEDGFQIIDDADLVENAQKQLMILTKAQDWTEREMLHKPIYFVNQDADADNTMSFIDSNDSEKIESFNQSFTYQAATSQAAIISPSIVEEQTPIDTIYNEEDDNDDTFEGMPSISSEEKTKFEQFQIPWDKFPTDLMEDMRNKKMFGKNELCLAANIVIGELRRIHPRIRKDVLSRVADELALAYPDSFFQKDKFGVQLSEKPVLLLAKLLSRRNYLNRAPMKKTHTVQKVSRSTKQLRESDRIAETVKNYQPNIIGHEKEMIEKRSWLKGVYGTAEGDSSAKQVIDFMDSTYGLQRFDINQNSSMVTIFDKWPFLVVPVHLSRFFKNLTGVNLRNFTDNFERSKSAIISLLENSNSKDILKILPGIVSEHIDIKSLKLVCAHFKEDFKYVAQQFPVRKTTNIIFF
jgi:hypothetical protein